MSRTARDQISAPGRTSDETTDSARGVDADLLDAIGAPWPRLAPEATQVDLRQWLPPVINQGGRPLCTAAVVAGLAAYNAKRGHGETFVPSVLYNYHTSRALSGDAKRWASFMRLSLQAWASTGLVEEAAWPDRPENLEIPPPERCHLAAAERSGIAYFRLDSNGPSGLDLVRRSLRQGLPVSVDFPLHPSLMISFTSGVIPVPRLGEPSLGRHVALAVGYDDEQAVDHDIFRADPPRGALLIRNSWGSDWGEKGYGWLPYAYLLTGLTTTGWIACEADWLKYHGAVA